MTRLNGRVIILKNKTMSAKKPTIKQTLAFKKVMENGGNVTKAMVDVGYSEASANTPAVLTGSLGWEFLMDKYLPDKLLVEHHKELLTAKQIEYFVFPKNMDDDEIFERVDEAGLKVIVIRPSDKGKMAFYSIADPNAKKNALDMIYKLRGRYKVEPEKPNAGVDPALESLNTLVKMLNEEREKAK